MLVVTILGVTLVGFYIMLTGRNNVDRPGWLAGLVSREESGPIANPPAKLLKCEYKGKTVYYLPPRCCDIPSILYDEKGDEICAPDGGLTGRGDGKCSDFAQQRRNCSVIWEDHRKYK